jgi:endonuclease YncB( thermonuclease family)
MVKEPMRDRFLAVFTLAVALTCATAFGRDAPSPIRIADGDTLSLCPAPKECRRIRLAGIDAPERTQPYSQISRQNLVRLCKEAKVEVEARKIDKYGRTIGRVTCDGVDVQREQLKAGLAWHYKYYENEQPAAEREGDAAAENAAKAAHAGLWAWPGQTPPWEFRHSKDNAPH